MHLSLNTKLNILKENNANYTFVQDPEIHRRPGEGRLMYKGGRIEYVADYVTPSVPKTLLDRLLVDSKLSFATPHDIAWSPSYNVILAYAQSEHGPFVPISAPLAYGQPIPTKDLLALNS